MTSDISSRSRMRRKSHVRFCRRVERSDPLGLVIGSVKRSKPTSPDHYEFRVVVNKCFPCRTGTLTCFMLKNNIARIVFAVNDVNSRCQLLRKSIDANNAYKVVKILFILELVDDWEDIQTICDVA